MLVNPWFLPRRRGVQMSTPLIVFVDDTIVDVELAEIALAKAGIMPVCVRESSEDGLINCLRHRTPDVIVSDLSLPSFDGLATLRLARSLTPGTPFIIYSGWIDDDRRRAAAALGALGCADKNRPAELVHLVKQALQSAA